MLQIKNLSYEVGGKTILKDISLFLGRGEKVGVVGVNGAGKSTLLKTIVGKVEKDSGEITMKGSYSYLSQEIHKEIGFKYESSSLTIAEYLILDQGLDIEEWEINKFLNNLNMQDKDCESVLGELSGGQKIKVELIRILLERPDILILDEPTNFLDIPSSQWLMKYLINYPNAVLVVSHDLRLMNRGLSKIWFLNELNHNVEVYKGNYDKFLKLKAMQDASLVRAITNITKSAKRLEKSAQQLAGRQTYKEAKRASRRFEKVAELKVEIRKKEAMLAKSKRMKITLPTPQRCSRNVLEIEGISKEYGENSVLRNVDMEVERGQKVVVIGKNGVGKTTLLKILAGKLEQTNGHYLWGKGTLVGYYAQEYENLDYSKTVLENVSNLSTLDGWTNEYWRKFLGRFLISGEMVYQKVGTLSGGEKTRLALAKLFSQNLNVLLLDEPTTYLDPSSQEILLQALREYMGTVIMVSHEPKFVEGLGVDMVLLMPEEKFVYYDIKYLQRVGLM
ncbi:ATP-binding cassette domain-containing protein [bacterium]|nr:ATP-binding cassette domain-containing protein [bacterium]